MKNIVKSTLSAAILTLAIPSAVLAQTSSAQFDQWYRAKYGRPAPTAQARPGAAATSTTSKPSAATVATAGFEQWYLAKYGRPAPAEEARLQAPQAATAVIATAPSMLPALPVVSDDLTAKTPAEHARLAQSYRKQAQDYLAQAKEHAAMVATYKASPSVTEKNQAATLNHCEYYAAKYQELAARAQQLSQLHERLAMQPTSN